MIDFNKACVTGNELAAISEAINSNKLNSDGVFTQLCEKWLTEYLNRSCCLLTSSCSTALEIAAILVDIKPGDEVIMPSYTFVSTANAFVLRGAKIVFVDIRPDTMNIDETKIEDAVTDRTKALVVVHYAGIACEMETILSIVQKNNLILIEDAAQAIMSSYDDKPLGSFGQLATFSFHATKNVTSGGEGGALIINDDRLINRAEIIRDKGTNRKAYVNGAMDKYTWIDLGSNYLMSEIQAAYLSEQFKAINKITQQRIEIWRYYKEQLEIYVKSGLLELPVIPAKCNHNAHIFYIKVDTDIRDRLIQWLFSNGVETSFHYIPLHLSEAGQKHARFNGDDNNTRVASSSIIRLPIWYSMNKELQVKVIEKVKQGLETLCEK